MSASSATKPLARKVDEVADDICTRRAIDNLPVLRGYTETRHKAKSWDRERRTVARIEATMLGLDIVQADDPETAVSRIIELVKTRIPKRFGLDPIRDIQVLCPMNRGGVGARSLNIELQAALNPAGSSMRYCLVVGL
jgi:ATP-dependent exoDNAse (exonuclease V) alpha subunit